jgi:3-phenylpropionate/trans-cinnamate dioxygenase ferredoxin subunit
MPGHVVGRATDVPPGGRLLATVAGLSIGVFNVGGVYRALLNRCAHQGGPLCLGETTGLPVSTIPGEVTWTRDGEIIRCPWHHWEFDLTTGVALVDPTRVRVRRYEVTVEPDPAAAAMPKVPTYPVTVESGWLVVHV